MELEKPDKETETLLYAKFADLSQVCEYLEKIDKESQK